MRVRLSTSVIFALGLLLPGCDDEVEDVDGVAWNGGSDDDDGEGGGAASDPWDPEGDDEDSWGDDAGEDPTGDDPTGDDPSGGDPTGGDPTGDDPSGGDPTGDDPSGGDPTDDSGDSGSTGTSPYVGGWDVGDCQASIPGGSGYAADIAGSDQFGESVRLHDFCHKAVLVVVGTFT